MGSTVLINGGKKSMLLVVSLLLMGRTVQFVPLG